MKTLLASALCLLLLAGCATPAQSSGSAAAAPSSSPAASAASVLQEIQVNQNSASVAITLPKNFVDWMASIDNSTPDEYAEKLLEEDNNAVLNGDGSITLTMARADYDSQMQQMKGSINTSIQQLPANVPSIRKVEHTDDFSEFTLYVDKTAYQQGLDGFAILGIYMEVSIYRYFAGDSSGTTHFILIDEATSEKFDDILYPEALNR